eukprot:GHVP01067403.1.p1 GENE.GHVP01067403.1~~GHVP01067403.1.p1  ORF type:complete len:135 (+),score=30.84 GHVP01067403.1:465-869(+)
MEFLEEISSLAKKYNPEALPSFDELHEDLPSETLGTFETSIPESTNLLKYFLGSSGRTSLANSEWKHFCPNLPYNPEIFKGSLDSPPVFLRSPVDEKKWFAAFPVQNPGQAGKIYGLLDEVGGKLIPTNLYLTL